MLNHIDGVTGILQCEVGCGELHWHVRMGVKKSSSSMEK